MSRAELIKALEQCVTALQSAPAKQRIDFEPYWVWCQTVQDPAMAQAQAALAEEIVSKKS